MRTKIFTLVTLSLLLLGLMAAPSGILELIYLVVTPIIAYLFASKFNLVPKNIYINYRSISYFIWLIKEMLMSSLVVIKIIWSKDLNLKPVFEHIEHHQENDANITLYANSITLTPGTVTVDISNNTFLVHALDQSSIDDLNINDNDSMAKRVKSIL
ncbi:MAG: Na+/H+ antiporter subunit E [Rickettsia endosymbiont of Bryobia graminum]|nr:Na+/H+ antiporter subunit E [Rickettsia endosymbiont of Bryobia graminum]